MVERTKSLSFVTGKPESMTCPIFISSKQGFRYRKLPEKIGVWLNLRCINTRCDAKPDRHHLPFVPRCSDSQDGRRLGIEASKVVGGDTKRIWLSRRGPVAPKLANSVFDRIQGVVLDPYTHVWPADRLPFCGPHYVTRIRGRYHSSLRQQILELAEFRG